MSGARIKTIACGVLVAMALTLSASAQTARKDSAREKLIGAWHLVRIDAPGPDGQPAPGPQPKGMLLYTRDGHVRAIDVSGLSKHAIERIRPEWV